MCSHHRRTVQAIRITVDQINGWFSRQRKEKKAKYEAEFLAPYHSMEVAGQVYKCQICCWGRIRNNGKVVREMRVVCGRRAIQLIS